MQITTCRIENRRKQVGKFEQVKLAVENFDIVRKSVFPCGGEVSGAFRRYLPKMLVCEIEASHGDSLKGLHIRARAKVERNFEPTHGKTLFRENTKAPNKSKVAVSQTPVKLVIETTNKAH